MGKYLPIILAAQYGSLNKAASLLGYAQPSMMYIINKMEDELGVKLFYRTKRGVTLTEAGSRLLEVMVQIEAQEDSIQNIAQFFQEDRLKIGVFPGMPGRWISELLLELTQEHPDILVTLDTAASYREGLNAVVQCTMNCCFSTLIDPPGVDCVPLCEDPYSLVISASHPLAERKMVVLEEVLGEVPLIPNQESFDPDSVIWEYYRDTKHVLLADSTPPDPVFGVALAEKGLGAALLTGLQLDTVTNLKTVRVLPLDHGPKRTLTLLCPPKSERSLVVNDLIERVAQFGKEANAATKQ